MGCPKAFWYSIHHPELAEALPPWVEIKYCYGQIVEDLVLQLAKLTGHNVTGEQDELNVDGIVGHRDAVIDGCLVDVKSMSSRGIEKLETKTLAQDDPFGYLLQLDGYVVGSLSDPLVTVKDKGYIIGVDKTLGHVVLYEHIIREDTVRERIKYLRGITSCREPPACTCGTEPEGKSGNIKLDMRASYSPFKYACKPYLRSFAYSNGPIHLTKVVREPNVPEITPWRNQGISLRSESTDSLNAVS